eukprot:6207344-Pleurochrysis_carterae.AAC.2
MVAAIKTFTTNWAQKKASSSLRPCKRGAAAETARDGENSRRRGGVAKFLRIAREGVTSEETTETS